MISQVEISEIKKWIDYDPITGQFTWLKTSGKGYRGAIAGTPHARGYIAIVIRGQSFLAHRLAWMFMYDTNPPDQIDHKNCIKTDNRIDNLRLATNLENHFNRGPQCNSTSGVKGVYWYKSGQKWMAQIQVNKKSIFLGYYANKTDAIAARSAADEKYQGEFAHRAAINQVRMR